jgi:hypothetical protein
LLDRNFTVRCGNHRSGNETFIHRPSVHLSGPWAQFVRTGRDGLDGPHGALGVWIDERFAELGALLLNDRGNGRFGPDDTVLDAAPGHVHCHLSNQFIAVCDDYFVETLVVSVEQNVSRDD